MLFVVAGDKEVCFLLFPSLYCCSASFFTDKNPHVAELDSCSALHLPLDRMAIGSSVIAAEKRCELESKARGDALDLNSALAVEVPMVVSPLSTDITSPREDPSQPRRSLVLHQPTADNMFLVWTHSEPESKAYLTSCRTVACHLLFFEFFVG